MEFWSVRIHMPTTAFIFLYRGCAMEKKMKLLFLLLLRCMQLGISMGDMELLSIGLINDMYAESRNDEWKYRELATQEDMDGF